MNIQNIINEEFLYIFGSLAIFAVFVFFILPYMHVDKKAALRNSPRKEEASYPGEQNGKIERNSSDYH
ncbi:hypothetical protein [Roseateles chitinivorans]|uniref:hypothetical protein n=1 Tax=Roseateles chitinivorans TaxID=2917965 RepID=UPI001180C082|nr:hypothetical protein [Roseateles chitinivorans]